MPDKINYYWEAFKEPLNLWPLAGLLVASAIAAGQGPMGELTGLLMLGGGLLAEAIYMITVPTSGFYRRLIERRQARKLSDQRRKAREEVIKKFDPREREAVAYLQWLKNQIYANYQRFSGSKQIPADILQLETMWERFVDFLDLYRRCKLHLRSFNRQAIENQIAQAERNLASADDKTRRVIENNLQILKGRLAEYESIQRAVKLLEAQLQSIENFFGLVNDKVVTMSSIDSIASLDFDSVISSIEITRSLLEETAPMMSALESLQREETPRLPPELRIRQ
ncbi:MAG: hypothetical protein RMM98_09565 [Acidobacteriota bacterium]|nr:hypothetical protein [Blastocatellia bacterium]MDW8239853.1 hypothetical protein [Acidobacteriota bacterium]